MSHFPVTNSNLSAAHLGGFLQDHYALGANVNCSLIRAGINDTYLVSGSAGKYVFRVYSLNWRTRTEIAAELRLLHHLNQKSIPVSYPIADMENNYIQVLNAPEGERFGVLFSYAPGQKLHNYAAETHAQIGKLMAQLHNETQNKKIDRVTYSPQNLLVEPLHDLAQFLPASTAEMQTMQDIQQDLLQQFAAVDASQLRTGIVHLDIWFDNLNINADGKVTLFDFDFCGNGWLCLDMGYYLMQLYTTEPDEKEYRAKAEAFLKGYESMAPISAEEKRILPMLGLSIYFFYLGVQCRRYENFSNVFLNEAYLKRYIAVRVKKYADFIQQESTG